MPFFKLKCQWYEVREKQKFLNDKGPQKYHRLFVANYRELPSEYLNSQEGVCSIWITDWLLWNIKTNFKMGIDYQFIVKLGEPNTAHFKHKAGLKGSKIWDNNMILKNKEYFKNTVQKIGFWENDNYFYEVDKKEKSPFPKPNQSTPNSTSNQNIWFKVSLICLPFLILALLLLIIKSMSKKGRSKN